MNMFWAILGFMLLNDVAKALTKKKKELIVNTRVRSKYKLLGPEHWCYIVTASINSNWAKVRNSAINKTQRRRCRLLVKKVGWTIETILQLILYSTLRELEVIFRSWCHSLFALERPYKSCAINWSFQDALSGYNTKTRGPQYLCLVNILWQLLLHSKREFCWNGTLIALLLKGP